MFIKQEKVYLFSKVLVNGDNIIAFISMLLIKNILNIENPVQKKNLQCPL